MEFNEIGYYLEKFTVEEIIENGLNRIFRTTGRSLDELEQRLLDEKFIEIPKDIKYFINSISDIKNNWVEYEWLYNILADEKSKQTLTNMICSKIFLDPTYVEKAYSNDQIYFDESIFGTLKDEIYIDCGGYTGDTAFKFILKCPDYRKIYVFEPIKDVAKLTKKNLKYFIEEGNLVVFEFAISNQNKDIVFDLGSLSGDSKESGDGTVRVEGIALDNFIKEAVTFIKMDIEGSEKDAILGASRIIKKNTPKMAICVYHKEDDFREIPKLILSLNSEYNLYLRQHNPEVFSETVLYCVPVKDRQLEDIKKKFSEISSDKIEMRIKESLKNVIVYDKDENMNILQHINDKKWFLYQLRNHEIEMENQLKVIEDLETYITNLREGKSWLESRLEEIELEKISMENKIDELNNNILKLNYKIKILLLLSDNLINKIVSFKKYKI